MDEQLVNNYLNDILNVSKALPSNEDFSFDIVKKTFSVITSTKIRKSKADEETLKFIFNYIDRCNKNKKTLVFNFLFGGYKLWSLPSAPHVSWSEVLHLHYMTDFILKVGRVYPHGINFVYRSDAPIISYIDNYPKNDIQTYTREFKDLIKIFNKKLKRTNCKILFQMSQYSYTHLLKEIQKRLPLEKINFGELDDDEKDQRIAKSTRNYCWNNIKTKNVDKKMIAEEAYLKDITYIKSDLYLANEYFNNNISVVFRKGNLKNCLHYETTSTSIVQFWVGEGVLELKNSRMIPHIYSTKQLEQKQPKVIKINNPSFPSYLPKSIYII